MIKPTIQNLSGLGDLTGLINPNVSRPDTRPVRFQKPDRSIEVKLLLETERNDGLATLKELLR